MTWRDPLTAHSAQPRRMLADDGTVLVVDGLVAEEFTVPASPRERTEYGWSVVSCLPGAMGDPQTAATGAVMRPSMLSISTPPGGLRRVGGPPDPHRLLALLPTAPVVRPTRVRPGRAKPSPAAGSFRSGCFAADAASAMAVRSLGPPTTMSVRLAIGH